MMQSEYLVELKRRRAITNSWTWQAVKPLWQCERWARGLLGAAANQYCSARGLFADQEGPERPPNAFERFLIRMLVPLVAAWRGIKRMRKVSKFAGLPPRTEEVYTDLVRERKNAARSAQI